MVGEPPTGFFPGPSGPGPLLPGAGAALFPQPVIGALKVVARIGLVLFNPDEVFSSNGAGDPATADGPVALMTAELEVTAHNHGFAVDAPLDKVSETPFGRAEVSHVCLNDDVVEGLQLLDQPAFSVQYHPEAAAGPHDAAYLFDRFVTLLEGQRA